MRVGLLRRVAVAILAMALMLPACDGANSPTEAAGPASCGPYPDPATSIYVLPFPVGSSAVVFQGNCGPYTHTGELRYATDFARSVGDPVVATRDGEVIELRLHLRDDIDVGRELGAGNYAVVLHTDGTVAVYGHLSQNGSLVDIGDVIARGEHFAVAGNTGYTGPTPHLHLEVRGCRAGCETIPITFLNADPPAPGGLIQDETYTALPY